MNAAAAAATAVEETLTRHWGRLTSLLLARFRRLDLVEDALGDAVEQAVRRWGCDGVPDNPAGWLHTTARRRILDRLRAETMARRKQPLLISDVERAVGPPDPAEAATADPLTDDLLRLVLMCTHPSLAPEAASAVALRLVLGVETAEVARLFGVSGPTMAARITRAKKKIVAAGIPFALVDATVLPDRLDTLAQTSYLAFTAGYAPGRGDDLLRVELAGEAIRLARVGLDLRPGEPVLIALLALMLLQHSRRDARTDPDGRLVLLADQDRTRWHDDEIAEAVDLLRRAELAGPITLRAASYALQAMIAAEHATAPTAAATRWPVIVDHYDRLLALTPTPAATLARAVAVAEADGPAAGLAALDEVGDGTGHRLPAVRAELLTRIGEHHAARAAIDEAIAACDNTVERSHLISRREAV